MRNHKLDQMCAKRLQSEDFAQPKYQPLLTCTETIAFVVMFLAALSIISYLTITTYFA